MSNIKPSQDIERMASVIEDAEQAFWSVVADRYREATHGDFAPDQAIAFSAAMEQAVTHWVEANADPVEDDEEEVVRVTEIVLHRIEYTYLDDMVLPETDEEHISYCISQGISEGELHSIDPKDGKETRGYWKINNCPA